MPSSFDMSSFNDLITQASQTIMCDSACQKQKKIDTLRQNVLIAQSNVASAPSQLIDAQQKYATFTGGASAAGALLDTQLEAEADQIIATFNKNFNLEVSNITTQIGTYTSLYTNFNNVIDLYSKYIDENTELSTLIKDDTNDTLTNDRKTYYQDQGITNLKYYYYYFFLLIYSIFLICFGLFSFWYPSTYSLTRRLVIFIGLAILPFLAPWILALIIYFIYNIYELLPKNVRLHM